MNTGRMITSAAAGVAAGIAAAWIMNGFQSAWTSLADSGGSDSAGGDEPSTVKAADALSRMTTSEPVPEAYREPAGTAVHYAFGAFLGAAYGVLSEVFPRTRSGFGTAYGAAVSLLADEIMVPAAGLFPPPQDSPPSSHVYGLVSHLVFGAALEAGLRAIETTLPREPVRHGAAASSAEVGVPAHPPARASRRR